MCRRRKSRGRYPKPRATGYLYDDEEEDVIDFKPGNGFPSPSEIPGGYSAMAGDPTYKRVRFASSPPPRESRQKSSRNFVQTVDPDSRSYYEPTSEGYTPYNYWNPRPRASTRPEHGPMYSEYPGRSRPVAHTAVPKSYSTSAGEQERWQYPDEQYGGIDDVNERYGTHSKYAKLVFHNPWCRMMY